MIRALQRAGSIPVKAVPAGTAGLGALLSLEFGRGESLSRTELTNATRELSIMLGAGQDIDRAMRFLVETAPNRRVSAVLTQVRDALRDGKPLAAALGQQPRSFPRLYIGLVRAGEAGGTLATTLDRLATLLERERSLASTVKSAMIYPALLLAAAIGSVVLLLTSVLPKFVPLFEQNGASLPRSTQLLVDMGDAVSAYGLWMLSALVLLGVAGWQGLQRPGPRLVADRWLLRIPVIGGLSKEVVAARFTRTLGTLLTNGVPLIAALGIVAEAVGNLAATAAIEAASGSAKGGAGLSGPLAAARIMPLRTIYLLRLGEETAQLGPMALRAAEIHEEKTRLGIGRLVSLLVPVITIVMGAVVAAIVSSLLMAMLSLNDLASG
ncbi:type II secretion system F family protein [Acidisphaera sp. L21]|uniref:type II secretion system F family protein n=1 Tax=Acidisphaera sp. L21 TaxID=1641851 RepID=UPI0020B16DC4|nr:type II secretion system F family protein [Acidisphaera sp. L21]